MDDSDEDEVPQLSVHTLQALQEFYQEQNQHLNFLDSTPQSIEISEDWQLSQFWYDDNTATTLAEEALRAVGPEGWIACVSCPTVYKKLLEIKPVSCKCKILEYDQRFSIYEDFVFYDYNHPLELSLELQHRFDLVIADPPFLSEECLTKTAQTIKYLTKGKILLCSGSVMTDLAFQLLQVKLCSFQPKHQRNLANEFRCYTNFDSKLDKV